MGKQRAGVLSAVAETVIPMRPHLRNAPRPNDSSRALMASQLGATSQARERRLRQLVAGLGVGTLLFGVAPVVAPRQFARLFGFRPPDQATASMIRSVGLRDAVLGMGLWSAASHGGRYAPWLLARLLTDGGDTIAVSLAVVRGERHPRFIALGGLALAATVIDAALYMAAGGSKRQYQTG